MDPRAGNHRHFAVAGIQARMGSSRLPGKSLADLAGEPMVRRVFDRVRAASEVDEVLVLTSDLEADDPLAAFCEAEGIPVRRGSEADVFQRYLDLMDEFDPRYVVRVTGDCPFVSPEHIDAQLARLVEGDGDHAPAGDSEHVFAGQGALSARSLRAAASSADPRDREHVGSFYLARNASSFRATPVDAPLFPGSDDLRFCVDEASDLEAAQRVYTALAPRWGSLIPIDEVVAFLLGDSEARRLASSGRPSEANRSLEALKAAQTTEASR